MIAWEIAGRDQDGHRRPGIRNQPLGSKERDGEEQDAQDRARIQPSRRSYASCLGYLDAATPTSCVAQKPSNNNKRLQNHVKKVMRANLSP